MGQDIDKREISRSEADRILQIEESHYVDLKAVETEPAGLSEAVSAFSNTAGGELFIGIDEKTVGGKMTRKWRGFENIEAANDRIATIERMSPLGNHYRAEFLTCKEEKGTLLHLTIFKTKEILKSSNGAVYVRRGAQKQSVRGDEPLRRLQLDKGIVSFEDDTFVVDPASITNSKTVIDFMLQVVPSGEPEEWLRKQNLLNDQKPTVAGILLFSDEPQTALPKRSAIKIYQYKTKEDEGSRETLAFDPVTIEGCVYDQIREAVKKTKEVVEQMKRLGEEELESVTYPDETLHEIITNAVLHRDYSIAADVLVRVYNNRIEIESPGRLPGHITLDNILTEQSARNPKIVRLINKFPDPPNKDVGEGLNTAFAAMKRLRLKEPVIEQREHSVVVNIRHQPLAPAQDTVMEYLKQNDEITNMIARDLTGIRSENSMKNVFLALKERGMIEPVPGKETGPKSAWRKTVPTGKPVTTRGR
jgi:ATP-dependent DNA helicase RecG